MRKVIIALVAIIMPMVAWAKGPEILEDKINSNGSRFIITNRHFISSWNDMLTIGVSLDMIQIDDSVTYLMSLKLSSLYRLEINSNSTLLIKLGNDEIIHLKSGDHKNIDYVGKYDSFTKIRTYEIFPSYYISEEEISKIINNGISKIRIEMSTDNYDKELSQKASNKLVEFISKEYNLILEALNSGNDGSGIPDITDGF